MKKLNILFALAAMTVFVACGKKVDVTFVTSEINVAAEGGEVTASLTSNGDWTVDSHPEWLTVSPSYGSGNTPLTLYVYANEGQEARSGEIKVSSKDNTATLVVRQDLRSLFIEIDPTQVECAYGGGQVELSVRSNIDWAVSELPEWIAATPLSGNGDATLTLTVDAWDSESNTRQATITVGSETLSATAEVVQNPKPDQQITVDTEQLEFGHNSTDTKTIAVTCAGSWTVECDGSWVNCSAMSGQGNAEIHVSVAENTEYTERVSTLSFVSEFGTEARTKIVQDAAPDPHFLNLNPTDATIAGTGGNISVNVECDTAWTAMASDDWMSIETTQGYGNGTFTVSAEANPLATPRQGNVKVVSGERMAFVTLNQEGNGEAASVVILPSSLEIPRTGGVRTLEIDANVSWHLQASPWITLLTSTGIGDGTCAVAVDANNTYETRTGFVRAYHENQLMDEIEVTQEGIVMTLEANPTEIEATAASAKYPVSITANQEWTAQTPVSWILVEAMPIQGTLIIAVLENTTSAPRSAEVKVVGAQHGEVTITVNQAAN